MVGKRLSPLLALIVVAAACAGCFVLVALSNNHASVLLSRSSPALLSALALLPAEKGNSNLAVRNVIKRSLDSDEKNAEGELYAHALNRAGLQLDPAATRMIELSLSQVKNRAASLSIDPKLQKQVKVAQSIQTASTKHMKHKQMSDKLRLAEAILSGTKSSDVASHSKKVVDSGKSVKTSMKSVLDRHASETLTRMEHNDLHPQHSKAVKALSSPMATNMMHLIDARDASMLSSVEHQGLSQQDLETPEWVSNGGDGMEGQVWSMGGSQASDMKALKAWYSEKRPELKLSPGVLAGGRQKRPMQRLDLAVGQATDGTRLAVFNGPQNSRIALEAQLRGELDDSAQWLQQKRLMVEQLGFSRGSDHSTSRTRHDRISMEARMRSQLEGKVHNKQEQMFHKSLLKESFNGASGK